MEIRGARESELEEIVDLVSDVFVERCRPRYASMHLQDSTYKIHQSRVCVNEGRITSYVRVSERQMHIGGSLVKLGGVGLVGTLEPYRSNGYSSAVLQDTVKYMASEEYDLGLLFTAIQPFYSRLGWASFPQTTFELGIGKPKRFERSPWTVRPFEDDDLWQVIEIHDQHNKRRTGTIARRREQWTDGYGRQTGIPPTLVSELDGTIGAYANVGLGESTISNVNDAFLETYYPNVREVGYKPGAEEALIALCQEVLYRSGEEGLDTITGRLPRHDPMTLLLSHESGRPPSFTVAEQSMYYLVSLQSLFQKLVPEFERRLRRSHLTSVSGSYLFRIGEQSCTLTVDNLSVDVTSTNKRATELQMDTYRFIKLLFGDSTFSEIAEYNRILGMKLGEHEAAVLDVLFPKSEHTYWVSDYF